MATSQTWLEHLKSLGVDPNSPVGTAPQLRTTDYGNFGNGLGSLMDLYSGSQVADSYGRNAQSAEDQANTLQQQMASMPTLAAMYGPDSSYAKQLQMQLAAKDAAAGRNSQYGPRLQALQANLADKGSQYASQQANMANMYNQARTAANTARSQATNQQQATYAKMGGNFLDMANKSGYLDKANSYLSNMFNPTATQQPMDQSPYAGGGSYSGYTTGSNQNNMGTQPYQSNGGMGQMYGPTAHSAPIGSFQANPNGPDTEYGSFTNGQEMFRPQSQGPYSPGMDTTQAPTSSNNSYSMDNWGSPWMEQ